jgi:hypothetical protein
LTRFADFVKTKLFEIVGLLSQGQKKVQKNYIQFYTWWFFRASFSKGATKKINYGYISISCRASSSQNFTVFLSLLALFPIAFGALFTVAFCACVFGTR